MIRLFFERWAELSNRVRIIIVLNWLFSFQYLDLVIKSFDRLDSVPAVNWIGYILAWLGMLFGGYFLLKGSRIGKVLTQLIGIIGLVNIVGYTCYGLTFLSRPDYSTPNVLNYTLAYVFETFTEYAYPIIAGFIVLRPPNEELGLQ